ncbi:MAG: hypothetical protein C4288_19960 [Leptolyngbya sp. ERB_1_1]
MFRSILLAYLTGECDLLELLSAGLVSGWLKLAGLPTSFDPTEMFDREQQFNLHSGNLPIRSQTRSFILI